MSALNDELPDAILERISRFPESVRSEYLKDCLQETRFSYFDSSGFLVAQLGGVSSHSDYLKELQEKYSRFLVYSAREWFISIPSIQCIRNPFLEKYLRLALSELLKRNIIQETEGWNYHLIYSSLILWALSPIVPHEGSIQSRPLELPRQAKAPRCIYCENDWQCMAKDKTKCHHKKFCCLVEAGVHLCKTHGDTVFKEDRPIGANVPLDDGRTIWGMGKSEFIDRCGLRFHDYQKNTVCLNEFGEYNVTGCPVLAPDWFMDEPDELDELELRVRSKLQGYLPPQSFWSTTE